MTTPSDRLLPSKPTVTAIPDLPASDNPNLCRNCPGWHRTNLRLPFGQCLPGRSGLPAPLMTTDLMGCTLPLDLKEKLGKR